MEVTDLYDPKTPWALYLINAIKAKELQKRDINYIVSGQEIIIVDEFTGVFFRLIVKKLPTKYSLAIKLI